MQGGLILVQLSPTQMKQTFGIFFKNVKKCLCNKFIFLSIFKRRKVAFITSLICPSVCLSVGLSVLNTQKKKVVCIDELGP